MSEKKAQSYAQFTLIVIAVLLGYYYLEEDIYKTKANYIAIGLAISIIISFLTYLIMNWKHIWLIIRTICWKPNKPIRISIAYLFRIEIDGKYLLVQNTKGITGYQPVGGVYKRQKAATNDLFEELGLRSDTRLKRDRISENDLRLELTKRRKLIYFINWFKSKKNRELDPWREFYEELIETDILSQKNFPHIQYRYVKQHREFTFSDKLNIMEYKVADIYEFTPTNDTQKEELRRLVEKTNEKFLIASADQIEAKQTDGKIIRPHTYKILA